MRKKTSWVIIAIASMVILLSSCGQKGSLYLPESASNYGQTN
ncbi:MAG: lipoprotein [Pseudomonadota bacterium]